MIMIVFNTSFRTMVILLTNRDQKMRLKPDVLEKHILDDLEKGLVPCAVVATIGTTGTVAVDPLKEIAGICKRPQVDGFFHCISSPQRVGTGLTGRPAEFAMSRMAEITGPSTPGAKRPTSV